MLVFLFSSRGWSCTTLRAPKAIYLTVNRPVQTLCLGSKVVPGKVLKNREMLGSGPALVIGPGRTSGRLLFMLLQELSHMRKWRFGQKNPCNRYRPCSNQIPLVGTY